jgi:leucyl-tRNA synthetase
MQKPPKYVPKEFESKWTQQWAKEGVYKTPDIKKGDMKMYILDMFPYPSGTGLHVGHVEGYTATDIYSRYMRMNGYKVLHPMGWDAFGLPAENYAVKTGVHPEITTNDAIKMFKKQIDATGLSYDWDRELGSHKADYYKWTQWLFLLLYKKGLAYRKEALVNWDPVDQTVLANEQVLPDGTADRSGAVVEQRLLTQWFFKITDYAERLLQDLDKLDWPESTKAGQRNWIGKSEGAEIIWTIRNPEAKDTFKINTFTTRFDTIPGPTFLVIAPEHKDVEKFITKEQKSEVEKYIEEAKNKTELTRQTNKDKTGVFTGSYAINPYNKEEVPVYIADYVISTYGTGAVMGMPGHDERDFEFAKKYNLPVKYTNAPKDGSFEMNGEAPYMGEGYEINSGEFDGLFWKEAREKIISKLEKEGTAIRKINYRLRDWLISRQRFWGAPIPVVYDKDGKEHAVDEAELPVVLPMDVEFKPTGVSPLKDHEGFQKVDESKYGKGAYREADTMDTFVDSSWYFFRFCDPENKGEFASKEEMNKWGPVDLYVGGAEHTVLHLLYARFFTKVLFDEGYITFDEPFLKLRHQGTILGPNHMKMSKSKGNVINPLEVSDLFGADTLRMYEMFMGPFDAMKAWNTENIQGVYRFLTKIWYVFHTEQNFAPSSNEEDKHVVSVLHKTIKKVTEDIPNLKFNTAISAMMQFMNEWEGKKITRENSKLLLQILAPLAPFMTEELWRGVLEEKESIHTSAWPQVDESLVVADTLEVPVQVNGKVRAVLQVASSATAKEDIEKLALANEKIQEYVKDKEYKLIYVPGKIVNFIVK